MKMIKKLVHRIDDELSSAEDYAEKYIEYKSDGEGNLAGKFKDMASDELSHAMTIHELAAKEIEKISQVFSAPADMREKWELSHSDYIERISKIKSMINM